MEPTSPNNSMHHKFCGTPASTMTRGLNFHKIVQWLEANLLEAQVQVLRETLPSTDAWTSWNADCGCAPLGEDDRTTMTALL